MFISIYKKNKAFKVLNKRTFFKPRQAFSMTNNTASSGLWKILHLPIFILTADDIIGCAMGDYTQQAQPPKILWAIQSSQKGHFHRCIVSTRGTVTYGMGKDLANILRPLVGHSAHHIRNS